jgi:hypothetical protein
MAKHPPLEPRKVGRMINAGFSQMATFRKARLRVIAQYTGAYYADGHGVKDGPSRHNPINLIYQGMTTMVPNLVYNIPRCDITTQFLAYREYGEVLELAVNHLVREINLRMSLRKAITDAIICCGWIKTGIGVTGQTVDSDGLLHDIGQPYADRVDPDDMFIDPNARRLEEAFGIGSRVRVAKSWLLEHNIVNEDKVKQLHSRYEYPTDPEVSIIGHSQTSRDYVTGGDSQGPLEYVDLVETWIPSDNVIVLTPYEPHSSGSGVTEFLRVVDYEGPETGPYHQLGFAWAGDNIMPLPPASVWYDMHIQANKVARKIARQAERQKSVLIYQSTDWEDAREIIDADDGETVKVDDIDHIKEVSYGGASDDAYQYITWAKQMFSEMAMNLDLLSGAGTNEPTATQAELVQSNASVRLADMQNIVYSFTGDIMRDLLFFVHTDPLIDKMLVKRDRGEDQQVRYTPEMREGDWLDYALKVRAYSMARQDPNVKIRRLMEFTGSVIPALANAFQMLGPAFKLENAMRLIGREMGIEEVDELVDVKMLDMMNQRVQELIEAGMPVDSKMIRMLANPLAAGAVTSLGGGEGGVGGQNSENANPQAMLNQANPMGNVASGVTPGAERNMRQQETAGDLQGAY